MAAKTGPSEYTYDIFLSFRGEDTRKIFTTRLYSALVDAGFGTFIDDNGIERGEDIKSELIRAIHHSRGSIVVLSKNYANSGWCLDELALIVENKKKKGHVILPVFYHVTKSDVGCQMGSFAEAFEVYEKRRLEENDDLKRSEWLSNIQKWRDALTQVAEIGGMNLTFQDEDEDKDGFIYNVGLSHLVAPPDQPSARHHRRRDQRHQPPLLGPSNDGGHIQKWGSGGANTSEQHNGVDPFGIDGYNAQLPHSRLDDGRRWPTTTNSGSLRRAE
ncbi:hypothetical protein RD792_000449 [Penstemon davidsonii]|uniref:ADP-ribosyl cyclase/cyclic ADP-ribose hydrolase n=1 Tax=Penstemon davidsonii TaxID=160366 RepID=A0ABR0DLQ7_9LAMI|nr:hypothetical protein RD792_000449 [Penstemon davidsonii]